MNHLAKIQNHIIREFENKAGINLRKYNIPQFDHRRLDYDYRYFYILKKCLVNTLNNFNNEREKKNPDNWRNCIKVVFLASKLNQNIYK